MTAQLCPDCASLRQMVMNYRQLNQALIKKTRAQMSLSAGKDQQIAILTSKLLETNHVSKKQVQQLRDKVKNLEEHICQREQSIGVLQVLLEQNLSKYKSLEERLGRQLLPAKLQISGQSLFARVTHLEVQNKYLEARLERAQSQLQTVGIMKDCRHSRLTSVSDQPVREEDGSPVTRILSN